MKPPDLTGLVGTALGGVEAVAVHSAARAHYTATATYHAASPHASGITNAVGLGQVSLGVPDGGYPVRVTVVAWKGATQHSSCAAYFTPTVKKVVGTPPPVQQPPPIVATITTTWMNNLIDLPLPTFLCESNSNPHQGFGGLCSGLKVDLHITGLSSHPCPNCTIAGHADFAWSTLCAASGANYSDHATQTLGGFWQEQSSQYQITGTGDTADLVVVRDVSIEPPAGLGNPPVPIGYCFSNTGPAFLRAMSASNIVLTVGPNTFFFAGPYPELVGATG